jgi:hypothetical protein
MAFPPDTNVWISLLKNPGGKLETKGLDFRLNRMATLG